MGAPSLAETWAAEAKPILDRRPFWQRARVEVVVTREGGCRLAVNGGAWTLPPNEARELSRFLRATFEAPETEDTP